jgi:hypothetical protein
LIIVMVSTVEVTTDRDRTTARRMLATRCRRDVLSRTRGLRDPGAVPEHESLGHYQMLWDCQFCGAQKLLAVTHRYCPECGAPQDQTKRYFPPDDAKVRVEDHVYVGADRTCAACGSPQSAKAHNCGHCGAPLDGAAEVKRVLAEPAPPRAAAAVPRKRRWWLWMALAAAFFSLFYVLCLWKKEAAMTVAARRWERAVAIEEYRDVQREAWRDQVPLSARGVSCHRQQRSTRQIPDGESCRTENVDKGDGTFEQVRKCSPKYRSEPVYDERCRYLATEWTRVDEAVQRGVGSAAPAWPVVNLPAQRQALGARREGTRREIYTVELRAADGTTKACQVPAAKWSRYRDGQSVTVEVGAVTGGVSCDSLP